MKLELGQSASTNKRIHSIDIVRGLVMIIMALDHVRDLMHETSLTQSPTDLNTTTPELFFTRWITYLCAPIFVFLSGASAYLSHKKNINTNKTGSGLWKRGLWLILLEFTLVNFALWFDFKFRILMLQVIAAIGAGLIIVHLLRKVNPGKIGLIALFIILGHNLLQFLPRSDNQLPNILLNILFVPGPQQVSQDFMFFTSYPLIPWIAIMLLGFACGWIFERESADQKKYFLNFGIIALAFFVILRLANMYGDPFRWATQKNNVFTILSFFNVTKYPPSLIFDLLFLGFMFILLAFSDKLPLRLQRALIVYGKVPLFYYLLHLYLTRLSVFIMVYAQGFEWNDLLFGPFQFGRPAVGSGLNLGLIYLVWIVIVILLYPLCKWYGGYKMRNHNKWWLRYL